MSESSSSPLYAWIRARQLEGTYPGDRATGIWPISDLRVSYGYGSVPEEAWPYGILKLGWPPTEPLGLDSLARKRLGGIYQRVRSIEECKLVLASSLPIMVSLEITEDWRDAPGRIRNGSVATPTLGSHTVLLIGYSDHDQEFKFQNSWGVGWGDRGFGYIDYKTFDLAWWEGWTQRFDAGPVRSNAAQTTERMWAVREHAGGILHCREIVGPNEERMAWTFAVQREDVLDVEELFVMPAFRRQGYGTRLAHMLSELASEVSLRPTLWIPYSDTSSASLAIVERLIRGLRLKVRESNVRWAPFVALDERDSDQDPFQTSRGRPSRPAAPFLS